MSGNIRYPEDIVYLIFNFLTVIVFCKKKKNREKSLKVCEKYRNTVIP